MIIYTAAAGSCGSGRYVSILRVQFKRGGWRALGPHGSHPHRLLIDPHVLWRDHGRLDTKYTVILVRISWFPGDGRERGAGDQILYLIFRAKCTVSILVPTTVPAHC